MDETYISFYLKVNRIHIFIDALRRIGSPARICFMISQNGSSLLLTPYTKLDFKSHYVSDDVYGGTATMEVHSLKLCRIISEINGWDTNRSYRVPGTIQADQAVIVFDLLNAWKIP